MRATTFTTYINAVEAANGAAAFDRMAQRAVSAYATITRAADQASDASSAVLSGRGLTQQGALNTALRVRANETRAVSQAAAQAAQQSATYTRATTLEGEAAAVAARKNNALAQSLRVTAAGLNVVQGPLGPLAGRVGAVASALEQLTGLQFGIVGVSAALFGLGRVAGQYQEIQSALRPYYNSQREANAAMDDVVGIALRSRTALQPLAQLYTRLTSAASSFGVDQSRIGRLVELASKAATLSGGSAESRKAGLEQFSQAVGSGNFAGDELKSVKENTSQLALAIAAGFKNADGSIGTTIDKLRELGSQGKLTTNEILDALERSGRNIEDKFSKLPATLSSATTKISTSFLSTVGQIDQAVGLTNNLAEALVLVADNMRLVVALGVGMATAFAAVRTAPIAKELVAQATGAIATAQAVKQLDAAWIAEAQAAKTATTARVAELEAERAEIRRNIAQIEALRAAQRQQVADLTPLATTGSSSRQRLYQPQLEAANVNLTRSNLALADSEGKLKSTKRELAQATEQAAAATSRFGVVTENVSKRTGLLKSAASGLLGLFGGPWGLVLTAATTALYLLATAESSAEKATRLHEDAQRGFASIIDQTTGKIYAQVTALEVLAKRKAVQESAAANASAFGSQRQVLARTLQGLGADASRNRPGSRSDTPQEAAAKAELRRLSDRVRAGNITYDELSRSLNGMGKQFAGISSQLPQLGQQIETLRETGRRLAKDGAGLRIGTANERSTDVAVFTGKITTRDAATRPNRAALDRQADIAANQGSGDPRSRAKGTRDAELLRLRQQYDAGGLSPQEYQAQRTAAQQRYAEEIKGISATRAARSSAATEARRDAREAEQDRIRLAKDAAQERLDKASTALEDRRPGLSQQEYLDARIAILKTYDAEYNAIDSNDRASRKASDQLESDARRRGAVIAAVTRDIERQAEINGLLLQGREAEARAVERTLRLVDEIGNAGYAQYQRLLDEERQQEKINDALSSRQRIVGSINDVLETTRSGFTQLLVDLPEQGFKAGGDFLKNIDRSLRRAAATQLAEKIFAGADGKLRALLQGTGGIESRTAFLASQMDTAGNSAGTFATATQEAAVAIAEAAQTISRVATSGGGLAAASDADAAFARQGVANLTAQYIRDNPNGPPANDNSDIVVTARQATGKDVGSKQNPIVTTMQPSVFSLFSSMIGDAVGGKVGKFIKSNGDQVLQGVYAGRTIGRLVGGDKGEAIGGVLGGASSLAGALSKGSGAVAKAASAASPYIAAVVAGFEIGTAIGKLLAPKPRGNAVITNTTDQVISYGNNYEIGQNLTKAGTEVQNTLKKVAEALGGTTGAFRVSIGQYKDYFRVSANGSDAGAKRAPNTASSQIIYDGKDAEEATRVAVLNAIQDGAVQGIREGAQRLLQAGRDLEAQVNKALKFQNVFDRLKQKTDPVGFAVEKLNKEFTGLIAIFKEAGASNQEYADLSKLYELERADAIKQATNAASQALDQFLNDMVGGSSSPLNKRDTYTNAGTALDAFRSDIAAGKTVDQNDLISAARNFQDSSRALNGSSQAFFDDFNALRELLTKARDNAGITNVTNLPGSPLSSDVSVQSAIEALRGSTLGATQTQTTQLLDGLAGVEAAIKALNLGGYGGGGGGSSFGGLPAFAANY